MRLIITLLLLLTNICVAATFQIEPLSPGYQKQLIEQGLWKTSCPVPLNRFRMLIVSYYDFHGKIHHNGKIVVMDAVAKPVIAIFQKLYQTKFPMETIKLVSDYHGDDDASMKADNTSSFNCRPITGRPPGSAPSIHAYGLAIDINPVQNPYISFKRGRNVQPFRGVKFLNRKDQRLGMVESIVPILRRNGFFIWGGYWHNPIDYQHFQTSRFVAQILAAMKPKDAAIFYNTTMHNQNLIKKFATKDSKMLLLLYHKYPLQFNTLFKTQLYYLKNHNIRTFTRYLLGKLKRE